MAGVMPAAGAPRGARVTELDLLLVGLPFMASAWCVGLSIYCCGVVVSVDVVLSVYLSA